MTLLTLAELRAATDGTVVKAETEGFTGVAIDGRAVGPGELFFAVRGERFDGHEFCAQAAAAGATGFVVAQGRGAGLAGTVVEVPDVRVALGQVGRLVRRRWGGPLVGITGSTGKTSTKELTAAALAGAVGKGAVLASEGSLNNETGVPLTLCRLAPGHRFAVVEMGMRGLGQIDYLAQWAEPDVGVVVNVGAAHVGVVGSLEAIARGKSEIWGRLRPDGCAIYPHGDGRLAPLAAGAPRRVTFGEAAGATVRVVDVEPLGKDGSLLTVEVAGRRFDARVPLVGRHNAGNAACALAVAHALGINFEQAARGLAGARPARFRAEVETIAGRNVLVDCYNANPASMRAALATLGELAAGRRAVAVLGDMLELGAGEDEEHAALGRLLPGHGIDHLVTVGTRARAAARAARAAGVANVLEADDPIEAAAAAAGWAGAGDWILVKASRGMRLERVVEALREEAT